jgi:hypothetical protein
MEVAQAKRLHRSIARLRADAATDIQAWLAGHAARPGMVTL